MLPRFFLFSLLLAVATRTQAETVWPQFRGADGLGHSADVGLPLEWSEEQNIVWKTAIPGRGWSSPVLANDRIWLTTATVDYVGEAERAAKVLGSPVADAMEVASKAKLWAVEIDQQSGEVLRNVQLFEVESPQPVHSLNSFASPTPVLAAGKLYCHFGAFGTACLDTTTGSVLWRRMLAINHSVGPGSSPVLVDGRLILTCDGIDAQYIEALSAESGETLWRTNRPPIRADEVEFHKSFSTPLLIKVSGEQQLVIPGAQWFVAYDPQTGDEIWRMDFGRGFSNASRPVFDGERVFLCTGFMQPQLWAVRPDAHGELAESHVAWKQTKQIPSMSSPIVVGERIYVVGDNGVVSCFDTVSGKEVWRDRMGGKYSASPLYADGRLYFCNHEGRTTVIAPGDQYQELARNDLEGQLMASPAVVEGDLLLRTATHLYRIGAE
ncbi:MAG: PQQ-binding-like beta-propeller repeat protein [Planctomycetales bacterium]|nr:PQQ-binding-like beta-propeller repeat protein [Planctomycetales bacterium]